MRRETQHNSSHNGVAAKTAPSDRAVVRSRAWREYGHYAYGLNPASVLRARFRLGSFAILPYWNAHLRLESGCRASGPGRLHLGVVWSSFRYMPSQMVVRRNANILIRGTFRIYSGHTISVNQNALLVLGSGFINMGLNLTCFERIEIGDNGAIAENVTIRDSDDHCLGEGQPTQPVRIGNHVWIGMNATVLKGVSVGDGAVVAAGSVVIEDVPPNSLVAGVPALVKKTNIQWS